MDLKQATPHKQLIDEIMDTTRPATEHICAARYEIVEKEKTIQELIRIVDDHQCDGRCKDFGMGSMCSTVISEKIKETLAKARGKL